MNGNKLFNRKFRKHFSNKIIFAFFFSVSLGSFLNVKAQTKNEPILLNPSDGAYI